MLKEEKQVAHQQLGEQLERNRVAFGGDMVLAAAGRQVAREEIERRFFCRARPEQTLNGQVG